MCARARKNVKVSLASVLVSAIVLSMWGGAVAKIPEPDNIIYGRAPHGAVTITLKVNGQAVASYTMGENPNAGNHYILRVPMDALEPAQPGTGHPGDEASIFVDDEYQAAASVTLGGRGAIHELNFEILDNDNDGLDDEWEQQIIDADPNDDIGGLGDVAPGDDFDGDGESNQEEYDNGTDPTDARSTNDPGNVYALFHFEIFRGADQMLQGGFSESFWGAELRCSNRTGETFSSGTLTKPPATAGPAAVDLTISASGEEAQQEYSYGSMSQLVSDFVAGDYTVDLEVNAGSGGPSRLRFKVTVPPFTAGSFPPYVTVERPSPGDTRVPFRPVLDFDTESWDYVEMVRADTGEEVYFHQRDDGDVPADQHRIASENRLCPGVTYFLWVDTNDWGGTWLGSKTTIQMVTLSTAAMPWLHLLLDD